MTVSAVPRRLLSALRTPWRAEVDAARRLPAIVLGATAAVAAALMALTFLDVGSRAETWELSHATLAPFGGALATFLAARRAGPIERAVRILVGVALGSYALGQVLFDLQLAVGFHGVPAPSDAFFLAAALPGIGLTVWTLRTRLERQVAIASSLDACALFLGLATTSAAYWSRAAGAPFGLAGVVANAYPVAFGASAGGGIIAILALRLRPGLRGAWAVHAGALALGIAWALWLPAAIQGAPATGEATRYLSSLAVLTIAYGGVSWSTERSSDPWFEKLAARLQAGLPIVAVLGSMALVLVPHPGNEGAIDPVDSGAALIVTVVMIRQAFLLRERGRLLAVSRAAHANVVALTDELEQAAAERTRVAAVMAVLTPGDTPERTADSVCEAVLALPGATAAAIVVAANGTGTALLGLAAHGRPRGQLARIAEEAATRSRLSKASEGPWVEVWDPDGNAGPDGLRGAMFAPLASGDRVQGLLCVATDSQEHLATLERGLPTLAEIARLAAALVTPALDARRSADALRAEISHVLDERAFHPVFQPIVEVASGRPVGFEALTRFDDGTRPDIRFADAASVGLGPSLEAACLRAAVAASRALPAPAWLSLNVSPELATAVLPLASALEGADREVVLEITEHEAIDDYGRLIRAVDVLGRTIRLAVDDAGAGYAGLRHILELRPHFVKLDLSVVRGVDADPARQAMVAGMVHFARQAGCRLIAEGVETRGEHETLARLGVPLAQGYLYGRPAPVH